MTSEPRFEEFKQKFGEIVRYVTLSRMQLYADSDEFRIVEMQDAVPHGYVFANCMSMIIISGKSLRTVLKAHFNHKDSKPLARRLFGVDKIDDRRSYDVMKEYCNLAAGFLKKICIEQNVPVGISLPVVTMGFNEVFTDLDGVEQRIIFEDCWKLEYPEGAIICSCHVDVFEAEALENMIDVTLANPEDADDDDEYDFL